MTNETAPEDDKELDNFEKLLLEMMNESPQEITAQYFDNEYGKDDQEEAEDYSQIEEDSFRPKMPLDEENKVKSALRDKIAIIEARRLVSIFGLAPLNFMIRFLDGEDSEIFLNDKFVKLDKDFLIEEIIKKDKSELPIEVKELFDECLEYLNRKDGV